jgi:hypothetical protein
MRKKVPARPGKPLTPSTGYFNAARAATQGATWLFTVGHVNRDKLLDLISKVCRIQAARRTFRPVFVLDDADHVELMRLYGFTFEVICPETFMNQSRAEQIETFKAKWGVSFSMDLSNAKFPS